MRSILVVAARPDDEVLGCGGTIAKLADEGSIIHVAFLADGIFSRTGNAEAQSDELTWHRASAQKACDILGVKSVSFGDFPDNRMDIVKAIETLIAERWPDTVQNDKTLDELAHAE